MERERVARSIGVIDEIFRCGVLGVDETILVWRMFI